MAETDRIKAKLERMEQRCRQLHVPLTAQRREVFEELASRYDHPAADEIYEALQAKNSSLSRTTVYRTLETLGQMGLLKRISTPAACARFDAETAPHDHFICISCEKVLDLPAAGTLASEPAPRLPEGFLPLDSTITVTGWCNHCREQV